MLIMIRISNNKLIFLLAFLIFLNPQLVAAYVITGGPSTITISAQVGSPVNTTPNTGGGGGGGGGGASSTSDTILPTIVNFSGMAYPSSKVTILNNGNVAVTTIADPSARFSVAINNLQTGTYNFSVFGYDVNRIKSLTFSFPVYVTAGTTVNIGGIFLSPTINTDKSEVKKGDVLLVFGQTIPNTDLGIIFHSNQEILKNTKTDTKGMYKYNMDTTPLEYGDHIVKSRAEKDDTIVTSNESPFIVGLTSRLKDNTTSSNKCSSSGSDINCDKRINLTDFSIMAYWFKKLSPPTNVDLNKDGKINLVDFSIMAFNWTG